MLQSIQSGDNRNHAPCLRVKDMRAYERPREKCRKLGAQSLEFAELLAILLRTGTKGASALDLAHIVLEHCHKGAYGLNSMTLEELMTIKGIGEDKAITICAAIEMGRRLGQMKVKQTYEDFSRSSAVAEYMMERLRHEREEQVCLALLDNRNHLISVERVSLGTMNMSLADQRTVFRVAIDHNAASIILIHNHPSGHSDPSPADVTMTQRFVEAGRIMGIPVLDHIIIGDGEYTSLCEEGYISS